MNIRGYSKTARWLHWTVALLVLAQIGLGFAADWSERPLSRQLLSQHVRLGLMIFALMILRVSWRFAHSPPPLPSTIVVWQRRLAALVHILLYVLLLAMPVTGYVLWAWHAPSLDFWGIGQVPILFAGGEDERGQSIAGYAHEYGAYAISGLIMLHIGAALFHAFVARDLSIRERMGIVALDGE